MKKLLAIALIAVSFTACNDSATKTEEPKTDSTATMAPDSTMAPKTDSTAAMATPDSTGSKMSADSSK